eukprot:scaffold4194_cov131-Isochrysis_galbana.AAC.13
MRAGGIDERAGQRHLHGQRRCVPAGRHVRAVAPAKHLNGQHVLQAARANRRPTIRGPEQPGHLELGGQLGVLRVADLHPIHPHSGGRADAVENQVGAPALPAGRHGEAHLVRPDLVVSRWDAWRVNLERVAVVQVDWLGAHIRDFPRPWNVHLAPAARVEAAGPGDRRRGARARGEREGPLGWRERQDPPRLGQLIAQPAAQGGLAALIGTQRRVHALAVDLEARLVRPARLFAHRRRFPRPVGELLGGRRCRSSARP